MAIISDRRAMYQKQLEQLQTKAQVGTPDRERAVVGTRQFLKWRSLELEYFVVYSSVSCEAFMYHVLQCSGL